MGLRGRDAECDPARAGFSAAGPIDGPQLPRSTHKRTRGAGAGTLSSLPARRRAVLTTMLERLLRLLTAVDRVFVTADRHPAGARRVTQLAQLARLGCAGLGLAVRLAALELGRSALALAGG
ncbi:hypothetical protein [Burkholderia glumae]|uniref:hypothetical protein n=1 Tax=Burkholderia glumae TaxID=337 RepID=UPI0020374BA1|nr:hypothetical protein [Burkholderia glumae]